MNTFNLRIIQHYILTEPEVINLVYTPEVISAESERKQLKKRLVWLTSEFTREHVPVNKE